MSDLKIEKIEGGVVLGAKIVPGSSRTQIAGILDGMLKVKIAAAPEKGKANEALIRYLSARLKLKKNDITIIAGKTNPVKRIEILNISDMQLIKRLKLE